MMTLNDMIAYLEHLRDQGHGELPVCVENYPFYDQQLEALPRKTTGYMRKLSGPREPDVKSDYILIS